MTTRLYYLQEELVVFLRNQNILSTSDRSVTTTTDVFTGNGSTTIYTLTNSSNLKNVRGVTVNGSSQVQYSNFTAHYQKQPLGQTTSIGQIVFSTAPANNATISANYDYGSTDSIFPDIPRIDLTPGSYPRVACVVTASAPKEFTLGGVTSLDEHLVSIYSYVQSNKNVIDLTTSVWNAINSNRKNFQFFTYITPSATGPVIVDPNRRDKVVQQNVDFVIPNQVENV